MVQCAKLANGYSPAATGKLRLIRFQQTLESCIIFWSHDGPNIGSKVFPFHIVSCFENHPSKGANDESTDIPFAAPSNLVNSVSSPTASSYPDVSLLNIRSFLLSPTQTSPTHAPHSQSDSRVQILASLRLIRERASCFPTNIQNFY